MAADLVIGWSIFAVVLLAILAFCWVYIRKYQSCQESEAVSTITAIFSLAVALIASALLPVDIFLVSFMKNENGTFKDWAENNETRAQIENTVLIGYYTFYSIILFCVFLWIPFVYFYYEEKDEDSTHCSKLRTALKYTFGFMLVCSCLLLVGGWKRYLFSRRAPRRAFAPLDIPSSKNISEFDKIKILFQELGSSYGLDALSFSISSLTLIGMLATITYTAYGMSALPLNLIKGTRNVHYERLENTEDIEEVNQEIERLRSKCRDGRPLSSNDRKKLYKLQEKIRTLQRKERHLESHEMSGWTKCCSIMRPFKIIWGIFLILVALLIIVSLFLSNLDKALHSAGIDTGFVLFGTNITNPLNILLPILQRTIVVWLIMNLVNVFIKISQQWSKDTWENPPLPCLLTTAGNSRDAPEQLDKRLRNVFPLDYILITIIIMYFFFTSMAGIRNMGIWFFWVRLYKIRRERTRPQALLFLCMILLLIVLHTSYMIYSLAPQYVMYGSQKYLVEGYSISNSSSWVSMNCDANAPADQCTVTRTYLFLHKFWFFSTIYYFGNWVFIGVFVIGFIVSCCKGKKSVIEGEVEDDDSDLSDDEDLSHIYS